MKAVNFFGVLLIFLVFANCKKASSDELNTYVFIKPYCTNVTVGGVVGLSEKCFNLGDIVQGKKVADRTISIRIAPHSDLNDLPANPNSFQEILNVPSENLRKTKS